MIRYDIQQQQLSSEIIALDPSWFSKANKRKNKLLAQGCYKEKTSIWSNVKPAYMKLQFNKCVFCERQFESPDYGKIEFDLEHFRPKSNVNSWPDPERHSHLKYAFNTGTPAPEGYFWLAYDPLNYAVSCKVCNTTFKLNYFPVANTRGLLNTPIPQLKSEQAYLCYPIGDEGEDPETLVTFVATVAIPTQADGPARLRGQLIIDFFGLNAREQLHRDRARMISVFGPALLAQAQGEASPSDLQLISKMTQPNLPHSSCLRAYKKLWAKDSDLARRIFEQCRIYMISESGTPPPIA